MIMETAKKDKQILLVLVPHRDIRAELKKYSCSVYKNILTGILASKLPAYSFPWAAPLAALSKPFKTDELKNIARSLRAAAKDNKFYISETSTCAFPAGEEEMTLLGQKLELKEWDTLSFSSSKIEYFFSPIMIGSCLITKARKQQLCDLCSSAPSQESKGFRAAAIANMFWKPVNLDGETAYKWKIGKLCWLPKKV